MTVQAPTLRHLGNEAADRLVLYLQDDTPLDQIPQHVTCNPRCHAFDAGVVAGRMPEILRDERDRVVQLLIGKVRSSTLEHIVQVLLEAEAATDPARPVHR